MTTITISVGTVMKMFSVPAAPIEAVITTMTMVGKQPDYYPCC